MKPKALFEKIGNTLVYLAQHTPGPLYLTKALKLLYLLDEASMKAQGTPFTWLEYKAWQHGPVAPEVYFPLRNKQASESGGELLRYVEPCTLETAVNSNTCVLEPKAAFNDDEFSDFELALLGRVTASFGNMTAQELVELLHNEGTLWHQLVEGKGIAFEGRGTSNQDIDLTALLNTPGKKEAYAAACEAQAFFDAF